MNDCHSSYKQKCTQNLKNIGEYSPVDFRAAYVTAEVYDLLMHVPYWELSARMNQQPPMHQLAVLFTGWVVFFHLAPNGVHHSP
jgi:hypothetical protein